MAQYPWLRRVRHKQSCGQSAAVRSGVAAARAPLIVTLDGDGQNDPAFIPALLRALEAGAPRVGLIAGQRVGRKASGFKKLQSRIANAVRGAVLRDGTRDTGCGLKAFRRDVFLRLPYFDGLHRFLPALVKREGYDIGYVDVVDRPRGARRVELRHVGPAVGRHSRSGRRVVADPPQEAHSGNFGGLKCSIDIARAVGGYLHDVFVGNVDWGILIGYVAQTIVRHALRGAMDRLRAGGQERGADRVLGVLDRRRLDAARLRALPQRPGVHHRAGLRRVRLSAQSAIRHPQRRAAARAA